MTSGGLAAVSSSAFAALYSAFGKYDVVHIHAEGPAFFAWLPKMFGKRVVVTVHGECEIIWTTRETGTADRYAGHSLTGKLAAVPVYGSA